MAKLTTKSVKQFISDLKSEKPTPGGGSAAALTASLGASLILMVVQINGRRLKIKKEKQVSSRLSAAVSKLIPQITEIIDEDAVVYSKVSKQYSLYYKAKTEGKRKAAKVLLEQYLIAAFHVQASLALLCVLALRVNHELFDISSGAIQNDLKVSRSLLKAAFEGAISTCEVNWKYVEDKTQKKILSTEMKKLKRELKAVL